MSSAEAFNVHVVFLMPYHSIAGDLALRDQRLSDYLNDRRETVVTLRDASIARLSQPGRVLEHHPLAVIPKSWVVVAFEPPQRAIPLAKKFYGYVKKQSYAVFLAMEGMEVRGLLHTSGELDLRRVATTPTEAFLPLTKAVVSLLANERFRVEQEAVMINPMRIRYIARVDQKGSGTTETQPPENEAQPLPETS